MTDEASALAPLLTIAEVALTLRQSKATVYRRIAAGELRAIRLGRAKSSPLRIPAAALDELLQPVAPDPAGFAWT